MSGSGTFLSIGECMIEMSPIPSGDWRMGIAGDTLNTAWYARARLPATWRVDYFTRLGTDRYSTRIIEFLESTNIGTRWISRDQTRQPGLYFIELERGERSFAYWRDRSAARLLADDTALLEKATLEAGIVYFSGITLAILAPDRRDLLIDLLARARTAGATVAFDPNIRMRLWEDRQIMRQTITRAAGASSIVLPGYDDERTAFGDGSIEDCALRYIAAGAAEVVVKNGGGPVCIAGGGKVLVVDDLAAVEPIDTTGAGDSFNGALLAARATGKPLREAVAEAHGLACRVIRHPGALMPQAEIGR